MSFEEDLITRIDQITINTVENMERVMEALREVLLPSECNHSELLDPTKLSLSEMSLCLTLTLGGCKPYLPLGFRLTPGTALFPMSNGHGLTHHTFLMDDNDMVICITPGQFHDFNQLPARKGDKLNYLEGTAPNLVRRVNSEVTVLRGPRIEIAEQLGFYYLPTALAYLTPELLFV